MSFFEELKRRNVVRVGIAYTVTAWLLLQLADIVFDNVPAPDWAMQTIMLMLAGGLPIALIFAWAFEMTPEGLKKEKDVDRTQSITPQTGRKLDRAIIVILVLALGYFPVFCGGGVIYGLLQRRCSCGFDSLPVLWVGRF